MGKITAIICGAMLALWAVGMAIAYLLITAGMKKQKKGEKDEK